MPDGRYLYTRAQSQATVTIVDTLTSSSARESQFPLELELVRAGSFSNCDVAYVRHQH